MKKEDIKTLTIIGSEVIINGVGNTITLSLEDGIEAVQYHKGYRILEEPLMKEVKFEKYQEFIDEWQKVEDMKNVVNSQIFDELANKIQEAKIYLASTDYKMTIDYFATMTVEKQEEVTRLRSEARQFVRDNEE